MYVYKVWASVWPKGQEGRFITSWGLRMSHIFPCTPCPSSQGYRSKVESRHFGHHCHTHQECIIYHLIGGTLEQRESNIHVDCRYRTCRICTAYFKESLPRDFWFFMNKSLPGPLSIPLEPFLNFYENLQIYSQLCVNHQWQQHRR